MLQSDETVGSVEATAGGAAAAAADATAPRAVVDTTAGASAAVADGGFKAPMQSASASLRQ